MTFQEMYKSGNTPWDIGKPDFNLIEVVTQKPVPECKALEIGCGTGDNSIWLAQNHFQVTGIDASDIAIEKAKAKASGANVSCDFRVGDFLLDEVKGGPFGFIFDRGCFHVIDSHDDRIKFALNVARHLEENGLWLSIIGNADERRNTPGPPQRSATDIVLSVEEYFEILLMSSSYFESNTPKPPRAWRCFMKRRG